MNSKVEKDKGASGYVVIEANKTFSDDLMTSSNGFLNYGGEKTTIVNIKRFVDKYFWIPTWTNNL